MRRVGIILVGTSVNPLVISLNNLWSNDIDKVYLLATKDNERVKGTEEICERAISIFKDKVIEKVIIDRSNIKIINGIVNNQILEELCVDECEEKVLYIDYTGGTKVQSACIREYLSTVKRSNLIVKELYVNGDKEKVIEDNGEREISFCKIEGANEKETIKIVSKLKGYEYIEEEKVLKSLNREFECKFDDVKIKDYIFKIYKTIDKTIKEKGGWGTVKLEIFEAIINAEKIGEKFCNIEIRCPKKEAKNYNKILNEMMGIKQIQYDKRIWIKGV